jgi:thiamine biosynthesis lipoprotein
VTARVAAVCAATVLAACTSPAPPRVQVVSDGRYVMGTVLEITLHGVREAVGRAALREMFTTAERYDALMTVHDSQSELSRLNAAAGSGPKTVTPELAALLRRSLDYTRLTRGSFDITVGPLVELWIEAAVEGAEPTPDALVRAKARVGPEHVRVHADERVELLESGISIDLGGIAKGYAVDQLRGVLDRYGIETALVDFGQSSTLALGRPDGYDGWRLLVRGPGDSDLGVVTLSDQAMSVSSSFGQWVEIGGRRYGHVIDPRSGRPLTVARQAVVIAGDATLAEALSKALLILEPAVGLAVIEAQPGCEGLLVEAGGRTHTTSGWAAATRWAPGSPGSAGSSGAAVLPIHTTWPSRT